MKVFNFLFFLIGAISAISSTGVLTGCFALDLFKVIPGTESTLILFGAAGIIVGLLVAVSATRELRRA